MDNPLLGLAPVLRHFSVKPFYTDNRSIKQIFLTDQEYKCLLLEYSSNTLGGSVKKQIIGLVVIFCLVFVGNGLSQEAKTTTAGATKITKTYTPEKRLDFEVEVPGTPKDVWMALATTDGLKTWLAPETRVDLRKGGDWVVLFNGASAGGGTISDFVVEKSLTIKAMAPESFPTVRKERTTAVFEIEPAKDGKSSIVRLHQTGWKTGEEWDKAFDYLATGNAQLLNQLRMRFVSGPFDWAALMKKGNN